MPSKYFFYLNCYSIDDEHKALINYTPDKPIGEIFRRNWINGKKFSTEPLLPLKATIPSSQHGALLDINLTPLPILSPRIADLFQKMSLAHIDYYDVDIYFEKTDQIVKGYKAINITVTHDPNHTTDLSIFRWLKTPAEIIIDENLKNSLTQLNIPNLFFSKI